MKPPKRLESLIEEGLIDTVVRQLMSGKEANVYVVRSGDQTLCAKIYKEATHRSFRQAVDYTENRRVKSTRQARAMARGTRYGRESQEAAWQSAEVDALHRLFAAGVRVPAPRNFCDGVLLMDLVSDGDGNAAPRLNDVVFTEDEAQIHHQSLLREVVRMLGAGIIHGDLSEFNILLAADGPVMVNLRNFFGRFAPALMTTDYGHEIWDLYERGLLTPHVELTGRFEGDLGEVDVDGVMREIGDALAEEAARRLRMQAQA